MKCSIIVPCYNEAKNIPLILSRFSSVIQRDDIEIILVNNGSTDNSAEIMKENVAGLSFARIVTVEKNQGYGFGVLSGLKEADGEFLGWTHADMQTDPADPIKALEFLENAKEPENTYIKGLRKGRPFFDSLFTIGMSLFETVYLNTYLWDINAQPNLFPRRFFESLKNPPHDFSLDLYVLYMAQIQGLYIERMPVIFPPRIHGQSSWNTGLTSKWKFIKRTVNFSLRLKSELARSAKHEQS